jgi:hypothetical protein
VCMCVYVSCVYVCMCVYVCVYACICVCVYMCACVYVGNVCMMYACKYRVYTNKVK